MGKKIAVALIHGIGQQKPDFANQMMDEIRALCPPNCRDEIVMLPVYWAPALQGTENQLWANLEAADAGSLRYNTLREFMVSFIGDAFAYQVTDKQPDAYNDVHSLVADTLRALAQQAGEDAPLCILAHSLGTIIASNYIYDLQTDPTRHIISDEVRTHMGDTSLERGETLTLLYTFGSPLALFSLRFENYGQPIVVPDPRLSLHYPDLSGEWVNFYDAVDVISYPIKPLNDDYQRIVTADRAIRVGDILVSWNPAAHLAYWTGHQLIEPIAEKLIEVWKAVNS